MRRPAGDFPGEKVVSKTCVQARQWALQRIFKPSIRRRFRRTDTSSESVVVTALSPPCHRCVTTYALDAPPHLLSPGCHRAVTTVSPHPNQVDSSRPLSPPCHHAVTTVSSRTCLWIWHTFCHRCVTAVSPIRHHTLPQLEIKSTHRPRRRCWVRPHRVLRRARSR